MNGKNNTRSVSNVAGIFSKKIDKKEEIIKKETNTETIGSIKALLQENINALVKLVEELKKMLGFDF